MKNIIYIIIIIAVQSLLTFVKAQDAAAKLDEAEKSYSSKDLDNTRYALQDALNEINKAIGKDILNILPTKLSDITYNQKDDNVNGAAGFAGLFVNRTYGASDGKNAKIEIMGDSPLLTSLNALLAMPTFFGASDPNNKRIKISGYKAMLKKETNSETQVVTYTVQIPLNQTLLTFTVKGIPAENDVIALANSLPIDKIVKIAE